MPVRPDDRALGARSTPNPTPHQRAAAKATARGPQLQPAAPPAIKTIYTKAGPIRVKVPAYHGHDVNPADIPEPWIDPEARASAAAAPGPQHAGGLLGLPATGQSPGQFAINTAMLFGPLRAVRAAREAAAAYKAGSSAIGAARAAQQSYRAGQGVIRPVAARMATRTFKHNDFQVAIPAARSQTGRLFEGLSDFLRTESATAKRTGAEQQRLLKTHQQVLSKPAVALAKAGKGLKTSQEYALRLLAEQTTPAERMNHHIDLARASSSKAESVYHSIHADLSRQSGKYVEERNGQVVLRADAPKNLKTAWELLQKTSTSREDIYRELGRLSDEQIAQRLAAPKRIIGGARYTGYDAEAANNLKSSQERDVLHSVLDAEVAAGRMPEAKANGLKAIIDAQAHSFAQANENPLHPEEYFKNIKSLSSFGGEPPTGALVQQSGDWADVHAFARDVGKTLPPEEWPQWIKNSLKWQGLLNEDGTYNSARAFRQFQPKDNYRPTNMSDPKPEPPRPLRRIPGETDKGYAHRTSMLEEDYQKRLAEWNATHAPDFIPPPGSTTPDTFPEDWLNQGTGSNFPAGMGDPRWDALSTDERQLLRNAMGPHWGPNQEVGREVFSHKTDPSILKAFNDALPQGREKATLAAMASAREAGDTKTYKGLLDAIRTSPLFQKGGSLDTASPWGVKGAIQFEGEQANIFLTPHSDVSTWSHEMAHYLRRTLDGKTEIQAAKWAGAYDPATKSTNWTRDAEEKFAQGLESYLRTGNSPQPSLTRAFESLSTELRKIYEAGELPDLSPQMVRTFNRLFRFKRLPGGHIVGAEDISPESTFYVPYVRGVPVTATNPAKSSAAYIRYASSLFGGGRKRVIGAGPDDATLNKAFKGSGLITGFFTPEVARASARSQMTAAKLATAAYARKGLLAASSELPADITDIAIKVDPKLDTPQELKHLWDKFDSLENGVKLGKSALDDVDFSTAHQALTHIFPSTLNDQDVRELAAQAIEHQEPIDNIRWVSAAHLEKTGLLHVPAASRSMDSTIQKVARAGGVTMDGINDLQKALILYLNPAYVPVNLVGNLVMNFMQQGPFLAPNLYRATQLHKWLEPEERMLIDSLMGHGLTGSLMFRTGPGQIINATLGHWINIAVDLMPRRAAFLHEMYKEIGSTNKQAVKAFLGDTSEEGIQRLHLVKTRANDAIVDYERLSPFERQYVNRIIFFYPWLKGASRWSVRFVAEHPIQAMGLAMAAEHARVVANQQEGQRPTYTQFQVPISTESLGLRVPGIGDVGLDQAVGKHQWTDRGYPMTEDVRQWLTPTTPLELYQAGVGFVVGDQTAPQLFENLTPFPSALAVSVTGHDPFTGKDVPTGLKTFLNQLYGGIPVKARLDKINMSKADRDRYQKNAINPRTKAQEIERFFGGGMTPAPFSPEIAAERVHKSDPLWKLTHDSIKAGMGNPPPEVLNELKSNIELNHKLHKNMDAVQKLDAAVDVYEKVTGDKTMRQYADTIKDPISQQKLYLSIRHLLFPNLNNWQNEIDKLITYNLEAASAK